MTKRTKTFSRKTSKAKTIPEEPEIATEQNKNVEQSHAEKQEESTGQSNPQKSNRLEFNELFWNDLYQLYKSDVSRTSMEVYNAINEIEGVLKSNSGFAAALVLYKRIVPTIQVDDHEPFILLYNAAIDAVDDFDYNRLCIFMRIATMRFRELKTSLENKENSRNGNKGNAFSDYSPNEKKREGAKMLLPLFDEIIQTSRNFATGYENLIVPKLVEEKVYFLELLDDCKTVEKELKEKKNKRSIRMDNNNIEKVKERFRLLETIQEEISSIKNEEILKSKNKRANDIIQDITKIVLAIQTLKSRIRAKFYRRVNALKSDNRYYILPSSRRLVYLPYVRDVIWKKLEHWPIKECLQECSLDEKNETDYNPSKLVEKVKKIKKEILNNEQNKQSGWNIG